VDYFQKVLWGEGMLLTPQHFQQSDRYHENLLNRRSRALQFLDWGFCRLEVDKDAMAEGQFALREATGVLPGGTWFDLPVTDAPPPPRPLEDAFPPGAERMGIYLAVAETREGEVNALPVGSESQANTAFAGAPTRVRDESDASKEREISVARKRLKFLTDADDLSTHVCLKVAEVQRTAGGSLELHKNFIPTCLYVAASETLMSVLRRLLDILAKKSDELSGQRRQRSRGLVEFTMSEAASFWFLHTVNGHLPGIASAFHQPRVHPASLYHELAALTGELYTFSAEGHPRDIPPYKHEDLTATFTNVVGQLRKLLGTVLPTRCVPIPLEKTRESVYAASLNDDRVLTSRLYLAVRANVPEEKLVAELPTKAKISSTDRVNQLIVQALPGIATRHVPTPPSEIPVQPGRVYFQVGQAGDHWEAVKASRSIAFYIPNEFPGVQVELMAVRE